MQALIKKAIEAIEQNKTERALGLLEGALEMFTESKPETKVEKPIYTTATPEVPPQVPEANDAYVNHIKRIANMGADD